MGDFKTRDVKLSFTTFRISFSHSRPLYPDILLNVENFILDKANTRTIFAPKPISDERELQTHLLQLSELLD